MKRTLVALKAVDWSVVGVQAQSTHDWHTIRADICGFLVKETFGRDAFITLTPQWFEDDDVRYTVTIPKNNIVKGSRKSFEVA